MGLNGPYLGSAYKRTNGLTRLAVGLAVMVLSSSVGAVSVRADFSTTLGTPFPSNRFSVPDPKQITGLRVALPMPNCAVRVSDCQDVAVLNELDGFSAQPRITIPFSGAIDLSSVTRDTVFLVPVGRRGSQTAPDRIGLNQLQWDETSQTLIGTPDDILAQHESYLLIVTNGIRSRDKTPVDSEGFWKDLEKSVTDKATRGYAAALATAIRTIGLQRQQVVAATWFTTQSVTVDLEKIQLQIKRSTPGPIDFAIGKDGPTPGPGQERRPIRAVFEAGGIARIVWHRQTRVGNTGGSQFTDTDVPVARLALTAGTVGQVAFGRFTSPDYETPAGYIPAYPTRSGVPKPQRYAQLAVEIFVPAGPKPEHGWPVAIFGHGLGDSEFGGPWDIASQLAAQGIATAAINMVGHGGGPLGTLDVSGRDGHITTIPSAGRGVDQDDDGEIDSSEGLYALSPRAIIRTRDGRRQTVVDLMQLVREIETGVDISGGGGRDLDANRIYFVGHSAGAIYGTMLLAVEPSVRAGALVAAGGPMLDVYRIGGFRSIIGGELARRIPPLLNSPATVDPKNPTYEFIDNIPLRNQEISSNAVAGAMLIQEVIGNCLWVAQSENAVAYGPYLRSSPLPGSAPKRVLLIFAKGDRIVPNPTTSALIRSGNLADSTTLYRADLAYAQNPGAMPQNPHNFIAGVETAERVFALAAQRQIATFLKTDGNTIIDPDGDSPIFETPFRGPLPERLDYYP
jgi:Alpha/beta hydrolase family/Bacterial virulence factor lipase N-terminal